MLVLSRKNGESIKLGPYASVRVVEISRNQVQLGIEAPRTMRVLRGELELASGEVREEVIDGSGVDHARYAAELMYCLQRLLGCTHDPSSERRVDLRGIPQAWIIETYRVIDNYETAMGVPTIDECLKQTAEHEGASTSEVSIDGVAEAIVWYSVERSLPDVMTKVMVASNDESYPTFPGYWDDDAGSWFSIHEQKLDGVTHWAEMPAGPV